MEKQVKNFKEALLGKTNKKQQVVEERNCNLLAIPRFEGGNLVIDLDEDDYQKHMKKLKYSVLGMLFLMKGKENPTTMELKENLSGILGVADFKIVHMGGGYFHIVLTSMNNQCTVMVNGPVNTSSGIFWVSRCQPGFYPTCLKSTTQVWVRIYRIPLEFLKEQRLINIASAVGTPLKIDAATISLCNVLYTRVLVDVDVSKKMP